MVHKLTYHENEDSVLLIPSRHNDVKDLLNNIKQSGIFSDVLQYDELFVRCDNNEIKEKDITEAIKKLIAFTENYFPVKLSKFEEKYIFGDHYSLGTFLVEKGIDYNYFEDGRGRLSTDDQLLEHIEKINPLQHHIAKRLGLIGNNRYVKNRYGDLTCQKDAYYNSKDIHFSIEESLKKLSQNQIEKLFAIFGGIIEREVPTNSCLLLTQHYINIGLLNFQEQLSLYQYLVDYFTHDKNLLIKIHPSDIHGPYSKWFNDALILDRSLPSELLPYCTAEKFDIAIAASSTAVFSLADYSKDIVCFTQQIEETFKSMNRYFTTLKLLKHIPSENKRDIFTYGINIKQLEELARHYKIKLPKITNLEEEKFPIKKKSRLFIIDDFYFVTNPRESFTSIRKNLNDNDLIIYLNSERKNLCFYPNDKTYDNTVVPIVIEKENTKDEYNTEFLNKETMFMITSNKEIMNIGKILKFEKDLKYTGIKIVVDQSNDYERKYLESKLAVIDTNIIEIAKNYLIFKNDNPRQQKRIDRTINSKSWQITKIFRNLSKTVKKYYGK
jgi:hypothetical protein